MIRLISNEDELKNIIENGYENDSIDFKKTTYPRENNQELIKDIMAMANSDYIGTKYIILGVKYDPNNSRIITGIETFTDSSEYKQLINSNIKPEIKFDYYIYDYNGKKLGIFEIYDCHNRPYMMKKQYKDYKEGICYIRKGSQTCLANREDYDRFYSPKKEVPTFKAPQGQVRKLIVNNRLIQGVLQDGYLLQNISNSIAYDVNIDAFLDVYILHRDGKCLGDIPPHGTISLSYLEEIVDVWISEITRIKGQKHADAVSHKFKLFVSYRDENFIKYSQTFHIGISWAFLNNKHELTISCINEHYAPKNDTNIDFSIDILHMRDYFSKLIEQRNYNALMSIEDIVRCLAWKVYLSSSEKAVYHVQKLFQIANHAINIGKGFQAFDKLKEIKSFKGIEFHEAKSLVFDLIYASNSILRHYREITINEDFNYLTLHYTDKMRDYYGKIV